MTSFPERREASGSDSRSGAEQRLLDLLAERATFGLDTEEEAELAALVKEHPDGDHESLDRIAAALAVAHLSGRPVSTLAAPAQGRRARVMVLAALAASLLAVVSWPTISRWSAPTGGPATTPSADEPPPGLRADGFARAREELLAQAADVVRLECRAIAPGTAADRAGDGPEGDIVWSPSRQRGFLRIRGLTPNDPRERQYQIWIVVGRRTAPVRGGVFDVTAPGDTEEVVVPILPQEFVQGPAIFAVTAEQPGGADHYAAERTQAVAQSE
jgi:hypothetical protein